MFFPFKSFLQQRLGVLALLVVMACEPPAATSYSPSSSSPSSTLAAMPSHALIPATTDRVLRLGRMRARDSALEMVWSGSQLHLRVQGDSLWLRARPEAATGPEAIQPPEVYLTVVVDRERPRSLALSPGPTRTLLATGLGDAPHHVQLFKRSEAMTGSVWVEGFELSDGGKLLSPPPRPARHLAFIGNSITCGYGNLGTQADCDFSPATEDGYRAYGAMAARELQASYMAICYSGRGVYRNYDGSQRGTLLDLYPRYHPRDAEPAFPCEEPRADAVVINLGTNDFALSNPDPSAFTEAYLRLAKLVRRQHPGAALFLLSGPMLDNQARRRPRATLQRALDGVAAQLRTRGDAAVYRFDLTPQGPLGYGCDWHPNLAQHRLNAQELAAFIAAQMQW